MLGKLNPNIKDVHVIGGGISGLLAAYRCLQLGYHVTIVEKSNKLGGMIETTKLKEGWGEKAAHSILATEKVKEFLNEIGCKYYELNEDSKDRFIYHQNRFQKFPLRFFQILRLIFGILIIPIPKIKNSTKLSEWCDLVLGSAATRALFTAVTRGIYGVGPEQLSVRAAFPALVTHEHVPFFWAMFYKLITKKRAKTKMIVPQNGMLELIQTLIARVQGNPNCKIQFNQEIKNLPENVNVVLSLPPHEAATCFSPTSLSDALLKIKYSSLVSVNVICEFSQFKKHPKGVGVLMTRENDIQCLGVLFNSSSFKGRVQDNQKQASLTIMYPYDEKQNYKTQTKNDLSNLFGFSGEVEESNIQINYWKKAIPIYDENILFALNIAEQTWASLPGNVLFGNYTGKVSIRGMIEDVLSLE